MTWEWVFLILGVLTIFACAFAYQDHMQYQRETDSRNDEIARLRAQLSEKRPRGV